MRRRVSTRSLRAAGTHVDGEADGTLHDRIDWGLTVFPFLEQR